MMIKGLLIRPQCYPEIVEFNEGYKEIQKLVEGPFEMPAFFTDVDIIVNEEGKINGSSPNRFFYLNGKLVDIIFGNILIADSDSEGRIISLSYDKILKYCEIFNSIIIRLDNRQNE